MEFLSDVGGGSDRHRPSFFELAAQGAFSLPPSLLPSLLPPADAAAEQNSSETSSPLSCAMCFP